MHVLVLKVPQDSELAGNQREQLNTFLWQQWTPGLFYILVPCNRDTDQGWMKTQCFLRRMALAPFSYYNQCLLLEILRCDLRAKFHHQTYQNISEALAGKWSEVVLIYVDRIIFHSEVNLACWCISYKIFWGLVCCAEDADPSSKDTEPKYSYKSPIYKGTRCPGFWVVSFHDRPFHSMLSLKLCLARPIPIRTLSMWIEKVGPLGCFFCRWLWPLSCRRKLGLLCARDHVQSC